MNEIDHLDIDGRALHLFLTVLELGSVTQAAARLGLTQSAVSHQIERLRHIFKDPLFVKSGRGIVATAHAQALRERARALLDAMKELSHGAGFDPASARLNLTIAANDFQRDLLLPMLMRRLEAEVLDVRLRVIPSERPDAEVLRDQRCDLLISPYPPDGTDILQKRILRDSYVCFYDGAVREAPKTKADYFNARHISIVYSDNERLQFDRAMSAAGLVRIMALESPSFSGVPPFLRGSHCLATLPSLLARHVMAGFAHCPLPFELGPEADFNELPMYMVWHRRHQNDPAHSFVRKMLGVIAEEVMGSRGEAALPLAKSHG